MKNTRWVKQPIFGIINNHIIDYPTPINLSYFYGFGSLAGVLLVIQILTGLFLAMSYVPHIDYAFASVEHIMRNINNGYLLRYMHANGASFFFLIVYIHIFRGIYFGSYIKPRHFLWISGVIIFFIMMATAFMGYVLPWGQMSFWGATVITNLVSTVPFIGQDIVEWLWGGFSISQPTLNRFFSLHFFLPFIIAGLSLIHLILLHQQGSNNPLGFYIKTENMGFYPYFYIKDLFGFFIFLILFLIILYYYPNVLGHPDNYIQADPMKTPAHIVPEWYFLPFYAILRSIPHKLGGVVAMIIAVLGLIFLPFLNTSEIRSTTFRPFFRIFFWIFFYNFLFLGWIGQQPVDYPFIQLGQIFTFFYFFFLFFFLPFIGIFEKKLNRL